MVWIESGDELILVKPDLVQPSIMVPVLRAGLKDSTFSLIASESFPAEMIRAQVLAHCLGPFIVSFVQHPCVVRIVEGK